MKARARALAILASLTAAALVGSTPAWAPGSLSLNEVMKAARSVPKLIAEMEAELAKSGLTAADVICVGARHGRHWIYLGGARAAPYSCKIGKREVTIEADQTYYDVRGRNLGDLERAPPEKAKTFRESNFRWSWSD